MQLMQCRRTSCIEIYFSVGLTKTLKIVDVLNIVDATVTPRNMRRAAMRELDRSVTVATGAVRALSVTIYYSSCPCNC